MNRPPLPGMRKRLTDGPISEWRQRAACRDVDPELFFPLGKGLVYEHRAEQAKAVCRACPVTSDCLQWALSGPTSLEGVWGATTEDERAALIRNRTGKRVS